MRRITNCPGFCLRAMRGASMTNRLIPGARNCAWTILNTGALRSRVEITEPGPIDCVRHHTEKAVIWVTEPCAAMPGRKVNPGSNPSKSRTQPRLWANHNSGSNMQGFDKGCMLSHEAIWPPLPVFTDQVVFAAP